MANLRAHLGNIEIELISNASGVASRTAGPGPMGCRHRASHKDSNLMAVNNGQVYEPSYQFTVYWQAADIVHVHCPTTNAG